ncbi:MBL fold metallo-hydrolase [Hoeflea sp. TYP-13]|uniref:MBL fold metallo-hydrolase n=1 Tax=Hoeflea sp. TYP-13 TaxID=3230023 RepID=UPI0034C62DBB
MPEVTISRRSALIGAACVPIAAGLANSTAALAAAPMQDGGGTPFARFKTGAFEVNTLLDAASTRDNPQNIFGLNVSADEFKSVSDENFIPSDRTRFFFTPTVINTGNELVLFDTGLGANGGNIAGALASAGYTPEQVDVVVITHMHPDHIGGLMTNDTPTFPNARYVTGAVEYDFWTKEGAEGGAGELVGKLVKPLAEKMTFVKDGEAVVSGVTAVEAFGHTPGHIVYMVESNGEQLLLAADLANHYVWSLAYPEWEVLFDMNKEAAAAQRKKVLGMLAADKIPFVGYHMPFPALGYVQARGSGFQYVPASYQLQL